MGIMRHALFLQGLSMERDLKGKVNNGKGRNKKVCDGLMLSHELVYRLRKGRNEGQDRERN